MAIPFFSREKKDATLLVDVGNGSVSCAVVSFSSSQPRILHSFRAHFVLDDKPNAGKLGERLLVSVKEVFENIGLTAPDDKLSKIKNYRISNALISFSSPWYVAQTKNIHIEHDREFIISERFIADILEKEKLTFEKDQKNAHEGFDGKHLPKAVEAFPLRYKINGYSVKNSINKKTNNLDILLYLSAVQKNILEKIKETVMQYVQMDESLIDVHTFPVVSSEVAGALFPGKNDFLMFDVTSEVTDITMVSGGAISGMVSFPSGRNFILRQIAERFSVSVEIAESMLRMFLENKIDNETFEQMEVLVLEIEQKWIAWVGEALGRLPSAPPSRIYLTAEDDIFSLVGRFMKMEAPGSPYPKNYFDLAFMGRNILKPMCQADPVVHFDPFISILALYCAHFSLANQNN